MIKTNHNLPHASSGETIFAWATAPQRSAVAILRLSGPGALAACAHFHVPCPPPRAPQLAWLLDPVSKTRIDQVLALYFPAPASFTGEDVLELHCHGSKAVMQALTAALAKIPGMRPAGPGEFSRRAFLNHKMDLTAIEGLADLINAETESQRKLAVSGLSGQSAQRFESLRAQLIKTLAFLEAYIDFPDEEIPESVLAQVQSEAQGVRESIQAMLRDRGLGEKIRDGFLAVILGEPNAGKSTLLNALAARDVAIVSDQPGTTRDVIEVHLDLSGYALTLADTAGLRDITESIEQEGIRRARLKADQADIRLLLVEASALSLPPSLESLCDDRAIILRTKCDLPASPDFAAPPGARILQLSAHTGKGLDTLINTLKMVISDKVNDEPILITHTRHRMCLEASLLYIDNFQKGGALEIMAEELRLAAAEIGKITGKIHVDELLDVVFSSFCIGK